MSMPNWGVNFNSIQHCSCEVPEIYTLLIAVGCLIAFIYPDLRTQARGRKQFKDKLVAAINMSMISMNDLFYGVRESVLILKDEDKDLLETIHRYNYFYAEPEPKPNEEGENEERENEEGENDSEENSKEAEPGRSRNDDQQEKETSETKENSNSNADEKKSKPAEPDGKVVFKVPMCCNDCEEVVTVALKNVDGVEAVDTVLPKRKVIVSGTAAPTSLLLACRNVKLFRKTRFWSDDLD